MNTLIKFFFLSIFISGFSFADQEIIVNDDSPILLRLGSENFQVLKDSLDANSIDQVVASENIKFRNLTKGELKSHNDVHSDKTFNCDDCEFKTTCKKLLKVHKDRKLKSRKKCLQCWYGIKSSLHEYYFSTFYYFANYNRASNRASSGHS